MKIGIVTTWFERGAAYVSKAYRQVLVDSGHTVCIFARGGEQQARGNPRWDSPEVTWAKRSLLSDDSAIELRQFRKWLSDEGMDAVLFNEQRTWKPVLLCQQLGILTVAYIDYYTKQTVPLFSNYDVLICNTKRHFSAFDWHPGARFVPWGVDVDLFKPVKGTEPVSSDCPVFFHSCGMAPVRKGTDLLIRAFRNLKQGSARLIIHSQKNISDLLPEEVVRLVEDLQGCGDLQIVDETVPAPGLYHLGDVYVYPSRLDGIGLTVCEALACGLPVVVPDNPPMNEFVPGEEYGLTVPVENFFERHDGYYWPACAVNVDELTAGLQYYIDRFSSLGKIKRRVREMAREQLSWTSRGPEISRIFCEAEILKGALREDGLQRVSPMVSAGASFKSFFAVNCRRIAGKCRPLKKMYDRFHAMKQIRGT